MSFLKQLLSPFIEFDEQKNAQTKSSGPPPPATKTAQTSEPASAPKSVAPPSSKVSAAPLPTAQGSQQVEHPLIPNNKTGIDLNETPKYSPSGMLTGPLQQHEKYFEELIEKANQTNPFFAGNDYKEFVDGKLDIDDIKDESLKYQTAFNILKSSGLTKDKLLKTGQEYVNIIGRDLNVFQSAHTDRYKNELGQKESELKKRTEQLQVLLQQANQLKKEINTLTQDIHLGADKLSTIRDSFILAGERKQDEIMRELEKIGRYF
ncbi:MAG: hypothetical protein ABJA70_12780 [Chryseolinea sp.]